MIWAPMPPVPVQAGPEGGGEVVVIVAVILVLGAALIIALVRAAYVRSRPDVERPEPSVPVDHDSAA